MQLKFIPEEITTLEMPYVAPPGAGLLIPIFAIPPHGRDPIRPLPTPSPALFSYSLARVIAGEG